MSEAEFELVIQVALICVFFLSVRFCLHRSQIEIFLESSTLSDEDSIEFAQGAFILKTQKRGGFSIALGMTDSIISSILALSFVTLSKYLQ